MKRWIDLGIFNWCKWIAIYRSWRQFHNYRL